MGLTEGEQRQLEEIERGLRTKRANDWSKGQAAKGWSINAMIGAGWTWLLWMFSFALEHPKHHYPVGLWMGLLIFNGIVGGLAAYVVRRLNAPLPGGLRLGWTRRTAATACATIFVVAAIAFACGAVLMQF